MASDRLVMIVTSIWAVLIALSYIHPVLATPTGDGFGRGLNLFVYFLGWQAIALPLAIVALVLCIIRADSLTRWVRIVGYLPAAGTILEAGVFQAFILMG